ncbi:MAG: CDP-alcohol phosphatidyltransferase family protein [Gammaproteobacteria bacterium]
MNISQLPNIITIFRFLLVPPVVILLLEGQFGSALIVFALAGFSDALDGFLAKQFNWTSRIGALLDPLADKLLLVSTFVTLAWLGLIAPWLVALVILRDLVIVTGAVVYHMCIEHLEAEPSLVSKLNTFAQILLVLVVMFSRVFENIPGFWMDVLTYSVLITVVWSGIDYVWTWSRRAWNRRA